MIGLLDNLEAVLEFSPWKGDLSQQEGGLADFCMLKMRGTGFDLFNDGLTWFIIILDKLQVTKLIFQSHNLWWVLGLVVIQEHLDCFLEIILASIIDSFMLSLVVFQFLARLQFQTHCWVRVFLEFFFLETGQDSAVFCDCWVKRGVFFD